VLAYERASERAGAVCILVARLSARAGPRYFPREEKVTHGERARRCPRARPSPQVFGASEDVGLSDVCSPRGIDNPRASSSNSLSRSLSMIRLAASVVPRCPPGSPRHGKSRAFGRLEFRWIRIASLLRPYDPRARAVSKYSSYYSGAVCRSTTGGQSSLDSFRCARGDLDFNHERIARDSPRQVRPAIFFSFRHAACLARPPREAIPVTDARR